MQTMEGVLHLCLFSLALLGVLTASVVQATILNSSKLEMFVDQLPDMPKILGFDVISGVPKPKSLEIGMFQKKWKFHRDLSPTTVFAFGVSEDVATVPGPTIVALHGIDTYVTWQNHLPPEHILAWDPTILGARPANGKGIPTVVHLHGGITKSESDGFPNSWFTAGFKEKGPTWSNEMYHYDNQQQPGNLMYHDHAMGWTRINLLAGLLGAYLIRHPESEAPLQLPSGDEFDRPLIVFDRSFLNNGSIYMNSTGVNPSIHPHWQPEYFGGAIIVNGKVWPRLTVRRRKYRFRILNVCNARYLRLFFTNGLQFTHVGSDSAYLNEPVVTDDILLGPAEGADVVVDFSKSKNDSAILANDAPYPYPTGEPVNEANSNVMKFFILSRREYDTSIIPKKLMSYPGPDESSASNTRYIIMNEYLSSTGNPTHLYLNAKSFEAPVTETPKVGTTELWYVINLTGDNHPFHIHLGLFVAMDQIELVNVEEFKSCMAIMNDAVKCQLSKYASGKRIDVPAHEKGWKNVFKMRPGFMTKILVKFSYIHSSESYAFDATAGPGYVYHCHILDHEDNEMMRPLKLTN